MTSNTDGRDCSALCLGCGICCDGTLYDRIAVTHDEESPLAALGFTFTEFEGARVFALPCPKDSCGNCAIYQDRPAICRAFRCGLLKMYQSGDLSLADAKAKQVEARKLIAAVAEDEPAAALNGPRHAARQRLAARMRDGDPQEKQAIARQFLNIMALDAYLESWFRAKEKPSPAPRTPG